MSSYFPCPCFSLVHILSSTLPNTSRYPLSISHLFPCPCNCLGFSPGHNFTDIALPVPWDFPFLYVDLPLLAHTLWFHLPVYCTLGLILLISWSFPCPCFVFPLPIPWDSPCSYLKPSLVHPLVFPMSPKAHYVQISILELEPLSQTIKKVLILQTNWSPLYCSRCWLWEQCMNNWSVFCPHQSASNWGHQRLLVHSQVWILYTTTHTQNLCGEQL